MYKEKKKTYKLEQENIREEILSVFEDIFKEFLRRISGFFSTESRPIYSNCPASDKQYPFKFNDNLKKSFVNQNWKTLK